MDIKNFAILKGNATVKDGQIKYIAEKKSARTKSHTNTNKDIKNAVLRADKFFSNGTLEFTVKLKSYDAGIILRMKSFDDKNVRCGYSRFFNQFVIATGEKLDYKAVSSAGNIRNYNINEDITFKLTAKGSSLVLYINNINVCEANISIKDSPIEFSISGDADFLLHTINMKASQPKIFIVMQFSKDYNELYEDVIKPVSEKYGYECIRADEYYSSTPILSDIITSIQEATAIIAEITPDNPNVFYEIGYSHAIKKPTILLCDVKREKLPFDLSSFRTLFYENTIAGKKRVEANLTKYLESI